MIQDLLLSRWRRNRKVGLLLNLSDLSNDARALIEQGHNLLIGFVYLLSTGRKSGVCV